MIATIGSRILRKIKPSSQRFLQHAVTSKISPKECVEVEINVPWGKITGKHWGPTDTPPIIAVHGWQDNAASFDPLVNYLPENTSILAIDLPGHGHSSWIPKGLMYDSHLYQQTIERIRLHYGVDKIGMISHSVGGWISFNYSSRFPENVKFVVAFDYFKPQTYSATKRRLEYRKEWKDFFTLEQKWGDAPRYSEAEIMQKSIEVTGTLNESICRVLFSRGTIKHPDGMVSFTRDPRVKFLSVHNNSTHEYQKRLAAHMTFPYRILKCENCTLHEPEELYYDVMKVIEAHSKDFKFHILPGTHHFHMDQPQDVANIINPFITKYI